MIYLSSEENFKIDDSCHILYFYAPWMIFHKKFIKMISVVEENDKNINFIAIDVDNYKNICKRYNVTAIPSIVMLYNRREINRCSGVLMTSAFKKFCNKYKEKENVRNTTNTIR